MGHPERGGWRCDAHVGCQREFEGLFVARAADKGDDREGHSRQRGDGVGLGAGRQLRADAVPIACYEQDARFGIAGAGID